MRNRVFVFGESEKGPFCQPIALANLNAAQGQIGQPPAGTLGVECAVQSLLYGREVLFYRVREEGYARGDYTQGLQYLRSKAKHLKLVGISLPGVGDARIIEPLAELCQSLSAILLLSEADLYDYLTGT